jgi:hypothetical protein
MLLNDKIGTNIQEFSKSLILEIIYTIHFKSFINFTLREYLDY